MNPMNVFKLKGLLDRFKVNHPKVPLFFKAAAGTVQEGSIIEIKIVSPENKSIITNFKINNEDIALVNELKDLM
ncbi:hypothetical protein [Ruminococcus sp.]|uniref:hypothetical protein n=1 Tax=Ruminococcus sp. TaxID=41978 RepID=UPI0025CD2889|nr:hypothetical protein [Ruminococcus sp.]MBO4523334.1 hypothetical protein [Ruminococcus sp.]